MKRLLIITQRVDESDDLLGFFVSWIRLFAQHFSQVSVITLAKGDYDLPHNVHVYSLGKEKGDSKFIQAIRFLRLLAHLTPEHDAVFAHMSPIFAIVAWPFAAFSGARLVLWYLHRSLTLRLRLATFLSDAVVTADAASLTLKSKKVIAVGHGIDIERFAAPRDWSLAVARPLRILSVGRLAPIKDFVSLIRAAAVLRDRQIPIEVRIVGRALQPSHQAYEQKLLALVSELALQDIVSFVGFVPYRDMPMQYWWADVVVGGTPRGGIDKVLLEAMAAGCIVLTSNDVMRPYLEPYSDQLLYAHGDAEALANQIAGLSQHALISEAMATSVRQHHDAAQTIRRISEIL